MVSFDPVDLRAWSGGRWTSLPSLAPTGFSIDSRTSAQDSLFVALKAERDGHDFLDQAIYSGAIGGMVDHPIKSVDCPQLVVNNTLQAFQEIAKKHREKFAGTVIGVTGSCGKTSTKEILRVLLPNSHCTVGNLNNHLGVPLTLSEISSGVHDSAVVEAGINRPDEMDELVEMINPDISIITSIEYSHLAGLGTLDQIAEEKIKLWSKSKSSCHGIFPEEFLKFDIFRKVMNEKSSILVKNNRINDTNLPENHVSYNISTETNERGHSQKLLIQRCGCPPLGVFIAHASAGSVRNMVLACVAAWKMGVSDEEICERLPQYKPSGLRGSCLVGRGCSYVLDCYNANPASMIDSINFFYEKYHKQPKLLVLGGMNELGDLSKQLHHQTGSLIHLGTKDRAILIGEHSIDMADGMLKNGATSEQIAILKDPENARPILEDFKGVVLLKGSRSFKLEKLIPQWALEEYEPMKIAC